MLLLLVSFGHIQHARSTNEQIAQRAESMVALFATLAKDSVLSLDLASLEAFVDEMLENPGVVYIRVLGYNRTLAVAGTPPPPDRPDDAVGSSLDDNVYDVSKVIAEGDTEFARVQIGLSTESAEAFVANATRNQLIIASIEIAAVAIFSILLGTYLTRQLSNLLSGVQALAAGNLGVKVETQGNDELTEVAVGFNAMSERLVEMEDKFQSEVFQSKQIATSLKEREAALQFHKQNLERLIAERTRELTNLSRSQEAFIKHANAPIFSVDSAMRIVSWNDKAAELTGHSHDDVEGKCWTDLFLSDANPLLNVESGQTESRLECELSVNSANGKPLQWLVGITRLFNPEGRFSGFAFVGCDTTERREIELQMLQASKLATLGEMATSVAHELNQPLVIISMAIDNCKRKMERGIFSKEVALDKFGTIREQVDRASEIIQHMRIFGRRADEEALPFSPVKAVQDAERMVREQMRLADVDLELEVDDALDIMVEGHKTQFQQVILNLITNARDGIESSASGPREIRIRATPSAKWLNIEVADTGSGIPPEVLDRVFEPFFTTKTEAAGTGLGLSISYGIVTDMGGHMTVTNIDNGASFLMKLPICNQVREHSAFSQLR